MRMITRSFCALILSAFASLVAATIPAASARADLSFDFNGGNDNGLTHYDPLAPFTGGSTYSFPVLGPGNDGYELTSGPSPDPANLGPTRVGSYVASPTFSDFKESVDILGYDATNPQALGLIARGNNIGLGTSNTYFLQYNTVDAPGRPTWSSVESTGNSPLWPSGAPISRASTRKSGSASSSPWSARR